MTPEQLVRARALLGWSRDRLGALSEVPHSFVTTYERNMVRMSPEREQNYIQRLASMKRALEEAGIEFTDGDAPGVRLLGPPTTS